MFERNISRDLFLVVLVAVLLGLLFTNSPSSMLLLLIVFFLLDFASKNPLRALSVFLICIPFSGTSLFPGHLLDLPGTKPFDLMALFVVFVGLINVRNAVKMPKYAFVFLVLFLLVFSFNIVRSLSHLDAINAIRDDKLSVLRYYVSDYIKPLIYMLPFIMIIKYSRTSNDLEYVINALNLSVTSLSILLLYLYVFKVSDKQDVDLASDVYTSFTSIHRNDLANFYILGFPIVLSRVFIKKNISSIISLCATVFAVGFLYSRTAYFSIILSSILYLGISKRLKAFPILLVIAFSLSLMLSSSIIERATVGIRSKDVDEISAGRTDQIWLPLIHEYIHDPFRLFFGNGRYSILSTKSTNVALKGEIIEIIDHPHNMYLELILDSGLIGFTIVIGAFINMFLRVSKVIRFNEGNKLNEYYYGILVSLICFFLSGMTGRSLFPMLPNSFFWVVLGILIASARVLDESQKVGNGAT
jgi:hypothetical protein